MTSFMSRTRALWLPALFLVIAITNVWTTPPQDANTKAIFLQYNCNSCHSIQSQGIARSDNSPAKARYPDLSGVGLRHNAAWLKGWLLKTTELNGKKHMKKFTGPAAELQSLTTWLATLKRS